MQAEDELASIGMVLGAGWAGARSMTSTAGPGISLMTEFIGLGYYAEIPAVIFDVQRVGPSTGLPTRTAQGDLLTTALLSHGDTKHPMLFPSSPEECFTMAQEAFDLRRAVPDSRVRHDRSGSGHEQLDVRSVPVSGQADPPRQGADRRRSGASWADSRATKMWMATASATARCPPPIIPRRRTSRAAAATTRRRSTPSAKTITSTTWTGWRTSSTPCASTSRRRWSTTTRRPKIGFIAVRHVALRGGREPRPVAERVRHRDQLYAAAAPIRSRGAGGIHPPPRPRVRGGSEPRRAIAGADAPGIRSGRSARLRSIRYYGGLPLDARTVTDEIVRQEGK